MGLTQNTYLRTVTESVKWWHRLLNLCLPVLNNRRDGVVVRASASPSVDLGFIFQVESYQKTLKNGITASLLGDQQNRDTWKTSRQACLLCPCARHLTGVLHLYVADRWWGQAVYPSWWPQSNWRFANRSWALMQYIHIFLHNAHNK